MVHRLEQVDGGVRFGESEAFDRHKAVRLSEYVSDSDTASQQPDQGVSDDPGSRDPDTGSGEFGDGKCQLSLERRLPMLYTGNQRSSAGLGG